MSRLHVTARRSWPRRDLLFVHGHPHYSHARSLLVAPPARIVDGESPVGSLQFIVERLCALRRRRWSAICADTRRVFQHRVDASTGAAMAPLAQRRKCSADFHRVVLTGTVVVSPAPAVGDPQAVMVLGRGRNRRICSGALSIVSCAAKVPVA